MADRDELERDEQKAKEAKADAERDLANTEKKKADEAQEDVKAGR